MNGGTFESNSMVIDFTEMAKIVMIHRKMCKEVKSTFRYSIHKLKNIGFLIAFILSKKLNIDTT